MILTILAHIKKKLQIWMLVAISLGLGNVYMSGGFRIPKTVLVAIVVGFVIFPVMINTKFEEIFRHFSEPRPIFCSLFLNFIVSPLVAFGLGTLFLSDKPLLFSALMLIALIPSSSMSVAWTSFSGARLATALYLSPLNIFFSAFVGLPVIYPLILGDMIDINPMIMVKNVLIVFFVPLGVGDFTRRMIIRKKGVDFFKDSVQPRLGEISATGVLVLVFLVMSLERNMILLKHPQLVIWAAVPVFLYYLAMYLVSVTWARTLIRRASVPADKAVVIIYTSVARHINIAMAVTLSVFTLNAVSTMIVLLLVAYMIQVPSLAFFAQKHGRSMVLNQT